MTLTYGSSDFAAAMKGAVVSSHPPGEHAEETISAEEFGQFEELTRKLVKVPKDELDERRRKKP